MNTKTVKKEKSFESVKTMREIRDQISKEIMNMTFAEEKAYLKKLLAKKSNTSPAWNEYFTLRAEQNEKERSNKKG